jgi:hypothetical protein
MSQPSPRVTDNQIAIEGLTEGANLRGASVHVTNNQIAIGGLTEGPNLCGAGVPVTNNQIAIGGLTERTDLRGGGVGREGQANRSHDTQSDSNHSILLPLVEYRAS